MVPPRRRRRRLRALVAAALLALAGGACEPDIGEVRFTLPTKVYRFDTTRALWTTAPATLPDVPCTEQDSCCEALRDVVVDCQAARPVCRAGRCALDVTMEKALPLWLLRDVPDLTLVSPGSRAASRVTRVHAGPVPGAAPATGRGRLTIHVAPGAMQTATAPESERIALVDPLPFAGARGADGRLDVAAATALRRYILNPIDPMSLILVLTVPVAPRAALPKGEISLALDVELGTSVGL